MYSKCCYTMACCVRAVCLVHRRRGYLPWFMSDISLKIRSQRNTNVRPGIMNGLFGRTTHSHTHTQTHSHIEHTFPYTTVGTQIALSPSRARARVRKTIIFIAHVHHTEIDASLYFIDPFAVLYDVVYKNNVSPSCRYKLKIWLLLDWMRGGVLGGRHTDSLMAIGFVTINPLHDLPAANAYDCLSRHILFFPAYTRRCAICATIASSQPKFSWQSLTVRERAAHFQRHCACVNRKCTPHASTLHTTHHPAGNNMAHARDTSAQTSAHRARARIQCVFECWLIDL